MVAPKGPGHLVRREYSGGRGVPVIVAVEHGQHAAPQVGRARLERKAGEEQPRPGRKMGHVTLLDDDTDRALATAEQLIAALTPA